MPSDGPSLSSPPSSTALVQMMASSSSVSPRRKDALYRGILPGRLLATKLHRPRHPHHRSFRRLPRDVAVSFSQTSTVSPRPAEYPSLRQYFHPRHVRHRFRDAGLYLSSHREHAHVKSSAVSPSSEAAAAVTLFLGEASLSCIF